MGRRLDILGHWHARRINGRRIINDAELAAGRRLQRLWDKSELSDLSSFHGREMVALDELRGAERNRAEDRLDAKREIAALESYLGVFDFPVIVRVVAQGVPIESEAQRWDCRQPRLYVAQRVRHALAALALKWGVGGHDVAA